VVPRDDGGIQLEQHHRCFEVVIDINPDGTIQEVA
jgi:hypothetical protein